MDLVAFIQRSVPSLESEAVLPADDATMMTKRRSSPEKVHNNMIDSIEIDKISQAIISISCLVYEADNSAKTGIDQRHQWLRAGVKFSSRCIICAAKNLRVQRNETK